MASHTLSCRDTYQNLSISLAVSTLKIWSNGKSMIVTKTTKPIKKEKEI